MEVKGRGNLAKCSGSICCKENAGIFPHDVVGYCDFTAPAALAVGGIFILVDFTLFAANLAKIRDGGWVPLTFGALVFATMATWRYGMDALSPRARISSSTRCRGRLVFGSAM
jgi:K+ potassium transporter